MPFPGIQHGLGQFGPSTTIKAVYRQPNAGSLVASLATIDRGRVCVFDFYQRGSYTSGGSLRAGIGATPNYAPGNTNAADDGVESNVTVINSATGAIQATRCGVAVLTDNTLAPGAPGNFVIEGAVQARCSGTATFVRGNRLSLDISAATSATAGCLRLAQTTEHVYAIALEGNGGVAGLFWVRILNPGHEATVAGGV